jgi:hypothetical protein
VSAVGTIHHVSLIFVASDFFPVVWDNSTQMHYATRTGTGLILVGSLAFFGCSGESGDASSQGGTVQLKPHSTPLPEPAIRRTVYVPVYSNIYLGIDVTQKNSELAVTVSVRNVSAQHPIVLNFVRYYDSAGKLVREYLKEPAELGPLASAEFVIQRADRAGGPGANFLVQWVGQSDVDEPLIEAVMIGQNGNAGISFTSPGRAIKNEPPQ